MEIKVIVPKTIKVEEKFLRITDGLGDSYTIFKNKIDGNPTKAYLSQQTLGDLTNKHIEVGYDESFGQQGQTYRNIKLLKFADEVGQQTYDEQPKSAVKVSKPLPKRETKTSEAPDWDAIRTEKTTEIRKIVAFKGALRYLIGKDADLLKHPEKLDVARYLFLAILNEEFSKED